MLFIFKASFCQSPNIYESTNALKDFLDTYKKGEVQKSDFDAFIKEVKEYVKKDDKSSNYFGQFYKDYIGPFIGAKA